MAKSKKCKRCGGVGYVFRRYNGKTTLICCSMCNPDGRFMSLAEMGDKANGKDK